MGGLDYRHRHLRRAGGLGLHGWAGPMSTSSIPSWAVPGAKVVCVAASHEWDGVDTDIGPVCPQLGCVYSIARTRLHERGLHLALVEVPTRKMFNVSGFRPVVSDDTEAQLFRAKRAPSRAARKRRQVASPAGTGEGGGATPCVVAALAAISVPAGEFLPSGTLAARFCPVAAGRAAPLAAVSGRQGSGQVGRQVGKQVEHGLDQSFSGFGTVGKPAATPETRATCAVGAPASPRHAAGILPGERA